MIKNLNKERVSDDKENKNFKSNEKKYKKGFQIKRKKIKRSKKKKKDWGTEKICIQSANSGKKEMKRQKESMTCSNFYKLREKGAERKKFIVR